MKGCHVVLGKVLDACGHDWPRGPQAQRLRSIALLLENRKGQGELVVYKRVELYGTQTCLSCFACTTQETSQQKLGALDEVLTYFAESKVVYICAIGCVCTVE
jgi:hypothetical protein